jgi:hypothetical protein
MKMILSSSNLVTKIGVSITSEENGESKLTSEENLFSASQSGKYSVTLHFRSREVRFPVQCQKFLVECGKNLVEYGKNVRTPLIYSFHS